MSRSNDWGVPGNGFEIYERVFVPAMMAQWAPKAKALAKPKPNERVLDVACGTGVQARLVARSVGPRGLVVGLDLEPEALEVARKVKIDSSGGAPIVWSEGDAGAIPFVNDAFDIVFCEFGLMSFPDRVFALKEMRRVLKPDGRLTIAVWGSISKSPGQTVMKESWERHFGADGASLFNRQHALSEPKTVLSLLSEAGFRDASIETVMGSVHLPSPEHLARSYGAMRELQADEETRNRVIDEVSSALRSYVGAGGLEYPIEAILASAKK